MNVYQLYNDSSEHEFLMAKWNLLFLWFSTNLQVFLIRGFQDDIFHEKWDNVRII